MELARKLQEPNSNKAGMDAFITFIHDVEVRFLAPVTAKSFTKNKKNVIAYAKANFPLLKNILKTLSELTDNYHEKAVIDYEPISNESTQNIPLSHYYIGNCLLLGITLFKVLQVLSPVLVGIKPLTFERALLKILVKSVDNHIVFSFISSYF